MTMKCFNNNNNMKKTTDDDGVFIEGRGRLRPSLDASGVGGRSRSLSGFSTDDDDDNDNEAVISTRGISAILHATTTAVDSVDDGDCCCDDDRSSSVGDVWDSTRFVSGRSVSSSAGFNSSNHDNSLLSLSVADSRDTHRTRTTEGTGKTDSIANVISKTETRRVARVRIVIVTMLVLVATGVSVGVYFIMKQSNDNEFTLHFEGAADKVVEHFEEIMYEVSSVSALAIAASAHSVDHDDAEWPYVSLSNFAERAGNARWSSGALQVSINPIVYSSQLNEWEEWVQLPQNNYWIDDGLAYQDKLGLNRFENETNIERSYLTHNKVDRIHTFNHEDGSLSIDMSFGPFLPQWQSSPVLQSSLTNENLYADETFSTVAKRSVEQAVLVIGGFVFAPPGTSAHQNMRTAILATLQSIAAGEEVEYEGDPVCYLAIPIFDNFNVNTRKVVATIKSTIHWRSYLVNLLPSNVNGITVVLENACDGFYTYEVRGSDAINVGPGDQHDSKFDEYGIRGRFTIETIEDGTVQGLELDQGGCPYFLHIYPKREYYESFHTDEAWIVAVSLAAVCLFTLGVFVVYDCLVEKRQQKVLKHAAQSTAIVSSLFPKKVRDRLMEEQEDTMDAPKNGTYFLGQNRRLKAFLNSDGKSGGTHTIADLYPNCTVMYADIVGFTAWSSTREPAQIFQLLQSVYHSFDRLAKRRSVFKVETIGDAYLAVTGLPDPQKDHAIRMAKFAAECLVKTTNLMKELEVELGPGTGNLTMRFGLYSGPVTAGVLRGERARFQLFGSTVNSAQSMESTGKGSMIQIADTTADLISAAGKDHWLKERTDRIYSKGGKAVKTFWLNVHCQKGSASSIVGAAGDADETQRLEDAELTKAISPARDLSLEQDRRIEWITAVLAGHIKTIVAVRMAIAKNRMDPHELSSDERLEYTPLPGSICLDEVEDCLTMPEYDARTIAVMNDREYVESVYMSQTIMDDIRGYVTLIASLYNDNPFHNFEHACHVTMSVNKLLHRIVAVDYNEHATNAEIDAESSDGTTAKIHEYTHGICSDPMAIFAIVFSALIHDVDHQGISNVQLAKEEPAMGELYRNTSVAEQNSLDVAWDKLMNPRFDILRKFIFGAQGELLRFRKLIVNVVMATDIFDKEINDRRKERWARAFNPPERATKEEVNDLRGTIVIEHIIQASDVCHTMQHWHVYQKFNKRLFLELTSAFKKGRMGCDPAVFWYKGELGFFDNYIIPLAKKLKECQVFGPFSDDYLNYAVLNRAEWEEKGELIVQGYIEHVRSLEKDEQTEELPVAAKEREVDEELQKKHDEHEQEETNRTGQRSTASTAPVNGSEDIDQSSSEGPSSPKYQMDKFDVEAFVYDGRRRSQPDNHKKIVSSDNSGHHAGGVGRRFRRFSMR